MFRWRYRARSSVQSIVPADADRSARAQPQLALRPSRSLLARTTRSVAAWHEHRERHSRLPLWFAPAFAMTVQRPNTAPFKSSSLLGMDLPFVARKIWSGKFGIGNGIRRINFAFGGDRGWGLVNALWSPDHPGRYTRLTGG